MLLLSLWIALALCVGAAHGDYEVGVGIADMTGPPVEIRFMGYASLAQTGTGIHLRQFARSFIFKYEAEEEEEMRFVYVSADIQGHGIALRREVIKRLQDLYGDMYTEQNVILTATHTHSTPGGYLVDFLFDVSILGFSIETFNAYVSGITESIVRAHENIVPCRVYFGQTEVQDVSVNRSPYSYQQNPEEERARYNDNIDTTLTQIRIIRDSDSTLMGVLNWYAVHTVSMNMTNQLVSSDNLGYAAVLMEKQLNPPGTLVGKGDVVCAFANSNEGDISPNTAGPRCEFTGQECDGQFLLCPGAPQEQCFAQGPGEDMFESTRIIAEKMVHGANEILNSPGEEITGPLQIRHMFVDMPQQVVPRYDPVSRTFSTTETVSGCVPAMGYSFAAGTTDGASDLNIDQGTTTGNPLLDQVRDLIGEPTEEDIECHSPKPILLATGRSSFPLEWHPTVISVSMMRLGDMVIVGLPGEFTTMAGRRVRDVVSQVAEEFGQQAKVVLAGLTNDYTHYITTYEEYQVQRYEGASTMYGPHTLDIYLYHYSQLIRAINENSAVDPGPQPIDNLDRTISLIIPVVFDTAPTGRTFGECTTHPARLYRRPAETVCSTFVSGNPRNNLHHGHTYAAVERLEWSGEWKTVATDADWETTFTWERLSTLAGTSQVRFCWKIPSESKPGTYRMVHYGDRKPLVGPPVPYVGYSENFVFAPTSCQQNTLQAMEKRLPYQVQQMIKRQRRTGHYPYRKV